MRKDPPALARREEREHKDLDHDGEKGEPLAHQIKVLGKKAVMAKEKTAPKTSLVVTAMKKQAMKTPTKSTKMKPADAIKATDPLAGGKSKGKTAAKTLPPFMKKKSK